MIAVLYMKSSELKCTDFRFITKVYKYAYTLVLALNPIFFIFHVGCWLYFIYICLDKKASLGKDTMLLISLGLTPFSYD